MESPQPMDLSSDEKGARRKIFVKTCPYCNDEYVIPIVFVSHLAGHIQFHSDLNLFKCNICDIVDRSSTVIAVHVEKHHAVKRTIFFGFCQGQANHKKKPDRERQNDLSFRKK